jgi:hypothetical protein
MTRLWQRRPVRIITIVAVCCLAAFGALRQVYIDYDPMQQWKIIELYRTPVSQYTPQDVILMTENLDQPPQWGGLKARLDASLVAPQYEANTLRNYPYAYQHDINSGYRLVQPPVVIFQSVKQISPTEDVVTYQLVGTFADTQSNFRAVRETAVQAVTLTKTAGGWKYVHSDLISDHTAWSR